MTTAATTHLDPDTAWMFEDDAPPAQLPIYLDRSTLERYADCPAQGHLHDLGICNTGSADADSGNEVHSAITEAIQAFVEGQCSTSDLAEIMKTCVRQSRPDVQAHAVDGLIRSAWSIASRALFQTNGEPRHPDDIMRHDGGRDGRSGQLAQEVGAWEDRRVLVTSELDLLMATPSDEEVEEWDWKSGRKLWSVTDIRESFQFGTMHPFLIFSNYPNVQRVHIRVWNTRFDRVTGRVAFDRRKDMTLMTERINSAVSLWAKHHPVKGRPTLDVPAWPNLDKCSQCDVATECPEAKSPVREVKADPKAAALQLIALEASAARLKKSLVKHVDENGPIELDGKWFGRDDAPKSPSRKPSAKWHKDAEEVSDDTETEGGGDA